MNYEHECYARLLRHSYAIVSKLVYLTLPRNAHISGIHIDSAAVSIRPIHNGKLKRSSAPTTAAWVSLSGAT